MLLDAICESKQVVASPVPDAWLFSPEFLLRSDGVCTDVLS